MKESIKNKVSDIMADFKMRGKEALNRTTEFIGLKAYRYLGQGKTGIADAKRITAKIDAFGKGMRGGQQIAKNP